MCAFVWVFFPWWISYIIQKACLWCLCWRIYYLWRLQRGITEKLLSFDLQLLILIDRHCQKINNFHTFWNRVFFTKLCERDSSNILLQINLDEILRGFQVIALVDDILCVIDIFSSSFFCFSWTGVCSNHHYNCGYNCYGGSDHLLVEPLQTLDTLLHQPTEPKQKTGRNFADGEYEPLAPNSFSLCCTGLQHSLLRSSRTSNCWKNFWYHF